MAESKGYTCGMDCQSLRVWCILVLMAQLLVSAALAVYLGYSYGAADSVYDKYICDYCSGTSNSCYQCALTYGICAVGMVLSLIIIVPSAMPTSRVWYRGGCYKWFQTTFLGIAFILYITLAGVLTDTGLDILSWEKDSYGETAYASQVDVNIIIILAWVAAALAAVALLLRILSKGGAVRRDELDKLEAQEQATKLGFKGLARKNGVVTGWDGRACHYKNLDDLLLRQNQSRYGTGWMRDTIDMNDILFIPTHPRWYSKLWYPSVYVADMPEVLDQGSIGTCTVNAVAAAYGATLMKEQKNEIKKNFQPSRIFMYYNTKVGIMGEDPRTLLTDEGACLRAVCKSLNRWGCCSEQTYPYSREMLKFSPHKAAYDEAKRHKVKYFKVPQTEYHICAALAQGHPVVMGMRFVSYRLDEPYLTKENAYLPYPSEREYAAIEQGGDNIAHHAVVICGYDRKSRVFLIQNSWGTDWADNGCFFTDFEYILDHDLAYDFWMFRHAK